MQAAAQSNGAGTQLRALGVEDAGAACGGWLSAVAADARPAIAHLLRSCPGPEQLAQLDAQLRTAVGAWRRGAAAAARDALKGASPVVLLPIYIMHFGAAPIRLTSQSQTLCKSIIILVEHALRS